MRAEEYLKKNKIDPNYSSIYNFLRNKYTDKVIFNTQMAKARDLFLSGRSEDLIKLLEVG
jgi:hypothetical protein